MATTYKHVDPTVTIRDYTENPLEGGCGGIRFMLVTTSTDHYAIDNHGGLVKDPQYILFKQEFDGEDYGAWQQVAEAVGTPTIEQAITDYQQRMAALKLQRNEQARVMRHEQAKGWVEQAIDALCALDPGNMVAPTEPLTSEYQYWASILDNIAFNIGEWGLLRLCAMALRNSAGEWVNDPPQYKCALEWADKLDSMASGWPTHVDPNNPPADRVF